MGYKKDSNHWHVGRDGETLRKTPFREVKEPELDEDDLPISTTRPFDKYLYPGHHRNQTKIYKLPPVKEVLEDIEAHGGALHDWLTAIDASKQYHKAILLQLYKMLEVEPLHEKTFDDLIRLGERASLDITEMKLKEAAAGNNVVAQKFLLERRRKSKFGVKATEDEGDNFDDLLETLVAKQD